MSLTLPQRYTAPAITLHWIIAVLMILNVLFGLFALSMPGALVRPTIDLHKSIGLTVFGLAVLRLLWRLTHPAPPFPVTYTPWERFAAHAVHVALYGLIFLLPLSGYLHDSAFKLAAQHPLKLFWAVPVPRLSAIANMAPGPKQVFHDRLFAVHVWLSYALYALFALHVLGALKHQFIDKEPELQRMLP